MPATTRRQAAAHTNAPPEDAGPSDIEQHLRTALHGVGKLRSEIKLLTQENTRLKEDLDRLYEAQDVSIQPKRGRKGNLSVLSLTAQVNRLRRQVVDLEDARRKDRKKIRKFHLKEVQKDALELGGELENGEHDAPAEMKRLLRRFVKFMSAPSMEEGEECGVCLTEMTLEAARSLACGHIFCSTCLPHVNPRNCPSCREPFESLEDAEEVQFTATGQWDALLEIATEWGRIDKGETPGDSEEEPTFIDDGEESSIVSEHDAEQKDETLHGDSPATTYLLSRIRRPTTSTLPSNPNGDSHQPTQQHDHNIPATPSSDPPSVSYQSSPISVKRQRMKELSEARMAKRTRK